MACTYTYQGKTYSASEFDDVLRAMSPSVASKYIPGVSSVPDAPMVADTKSWVALGIKRAIRHAVDVGADGIVFGTGEQNANLYDLSKQVDRLDIEPYGIESGVQQYRVTAMKDGARAIDRTVAEPELSNVVGKDIAKEAISGKTRFEGEGLRVGGEGMRAFYDQIVPQVANEVLKKIGGGKVGMVDTRPSDPNELGRWIQPGFPLTDSMKATVRQGMPLFAKAPRQAPLPGVAGTVPPAPPAGQANIPLQGGAPGNNASWNMPEPSMLDNIIYKLQDKNIDLKRAIDGIRASGVALVDKWDAYLQEELFHGRSAKRVQDFVDRELVPLLEQMRVAGIGQQELNDYLHARHAEEANELIRQRDPSMQDGGSGLTDAQARDYFAGNDSRDANGDLIIKGMDLNKRAELANAAALVDSILARTRGLYVSYGLESANTVRGWEDMFDFYVPLMREDHDGGMGVGQGYSIKGREAKHRTGSTASVVDILANIALQREKAIVRGEKNRVAVSLAGLVKLNPAPDIWKFGPVPERRFNPNTGLVEYLTNGTWKSADNVIVAKIRDAKGEIQERGIILNERNERATRLAQAMKNLDVGSLEGALGISAKITRYFASVNTQYNPVFGAINLTRDVQTALLNLGSTPLAGQQKAIMRHVGSALKGIYQDARADRKGHAATSPWAKLWEEFNLEGGQTGYRDLFRTSADRAKAIQRVLTPDGWMDSGLGKVFTVNGVLRVPISKASPAVKWMFEWLSDYNLAMENAVRISAYKVALDSGMSKQRAASLAKNLTVNFNRKGQATQQLGAMYAFFNASMQGSARMAKTVFDIDNGDIKTVRLSKLGKRVVYGGLMLGAAQALALLAAGFDDDEPPEFVKERNLIIPLGFGSKKYISIPMPLGFHVLPNLGRIVTELALDGFDHGGKRMADMLGMLIESFNPMGGAGLSVQTITPTALDPLVALSENKDWTGKPIAKEDFSSLSQTPGHTRAKDVSSHPSRLLSEAINWISGGDQYVPGALSPTPDQIDYLWGQVTGGVGRELGKLATTVTSIATGESLPPHKIPLLGRLYGDAGDESGKASKFYDNLRDINTHELVVDGLMKDGKANDAMVYIKENPEAILIKMANRVEYSVREMNRRKRALIKADASEEQVKAVEKLIALQMDTLNKKAEELQNME